MGVATCIKYSCAEREYLCPILLSPFMPSFRRSRRLDNKVMLTLLTSPTTTWLNAGSSCSMKPFEANTERKMLGLLSTAFKTNSISCLVVILHRELKTNFFSIMYSIGPTAHIHKTLINQYLTPDNKFTTH